MNLSDLPPWLLAGAAGVAVAALWLGHSKFYPFTNCPLCSGSSKRKAGKLKVFRDCPVCKGSGRRRRLGKVLLDRKAGLPVLVVAALLAGGLVAAGRLKMPEASATGTDGGKAIVAELAKTATASRSDSGYQRGAFGGWADTDHSGCNARDDVMRRDLAEDRPASGCGLSSGVLMADPYTGQRITYQHGGPSEIDVDHVVPLSAAWQRGASKWTTARRLAFANDPGNLLAVSASANRSKGDKSLSQWLPVLSGRCVYVLAFLRVSVRYQLPITSADKRTAETVARSC